MPDLEYLIQSFQQDSTRDLAWALFSPELLHNPASPPFLVEPSAKRLQWLHDIDAQRLQFPAQHRLGRYYEALWEYFFRHDEQYQLIAHNVAIRKNGQTLGELDFVIFDTFSQRYIHLEIAVKFYLHYPHSNTSIDNAAWLGPDSRDNLAKKWRKLNLEQSLLSQKEECQTRLEQLGIQLPVDHAVSLKGYLFRPDNSTAMPQLFNRQNKLYRYYRCENLLQKTFTDASTGIIPKSCWLQQCHGKNSIVLSTPEQMIEQVITGNRPLMAGIFAESASHAVETERFFIVPPTWPNPDKNQRIR